MNNKINDADFMTKFPPALQKDKSMYALGKIIADELHTTANEIKKNIIYPNIDDLPEKWLDVLAYDLHVDWYDYDYPIETKRAIIKNSVRVHQKLGTKYAVETAMRDIYDGVMISEWFEYGGKPYFFQIKIDISSEKMTENTYMEILNRVDFYKNLRSHCDSVSIRLHGSSSIIRVQAAGGVGVVLKVKAKTAGKIQSEETLRIMAAGEVGHMLKVKATTEKRIETKEVLGVVAAEKTGTLLKVKATTEDSIKTKEALLLFSVLSSLKNICYRQIN